MGRIKTNDVKRVTFEIVKGHSDKLCSDFDKNKGPVTSLLGGTPNKKLRNRVAGYVTRLIRAKK
jgi:small subunit ribosomal protein S17e